MRERLRSALTAASLLAALGAAGCGQKGPLYLPDEAGEVVTRPTQTPAPNPAAPDSSAPPTPTPPPTPEPPPTDNSNDPTKPPRP